MLFNSFILEVILLLILGGPSNTPGAACSSVQMYKDIGVTQICSVSELISEMEKTYCSELA